MKNIVAIIILSFLYKCTAQNSGNFLDKFALLNEMPSSVSLQNLKVGVNDTVSRNILSNVFLLNINEIDFSSSYSRIQYYYFGKYKLSERFYLIGYKKFYEHNEASIVYSVYDNINKTIISKITLEESYKIIRKSSFANGVFTIKNIYRIPKGLDPSPYNPKIVKEIVERYKLNENYIFTKLE